MEVAAWRQLQAASEDERKRHVAAVDSLRIDHCGVLSGLQADQAAQVVEYEQHIQTLEQQLQTERDQHAENISELRETIASMKTEFDASAFQTADERAQLLRDWLDKETQLSLEIAQLRDALAASRGEMEELVRSNDERVAEMQQATSEAVAGLRAQIDDLLHDNKSQETALADFQADKARAEEEREDLLHQLIGRNELIKAKDLSADALSVHAASIQAQLTLCEADLRSSNEAVRTMEEKSQALFLSVADIQARLADKADLAAEAAAERDSLRDRLQEAGRQLSCQERDEEAMMVQLRASIATLEAKLSDVVKAHDKVQRQLDEASFRYAPM